MSAIEKYMKIKKIKTTLSREDFIRIVNVPSMSQFYIDRLNASIGVMLDFKIITLSTWSRYKRLIEGLSIQGVTLKGTL